MRGKWPTPALASTLSSACTATKPAPIRACVGVGVDSSKFACVVAGVSVGSGVRKAVGVGDGKGAGLQSHVYRGNLISNKTLSSPLAPTPMTSQQRGSIIAPPNCERPVHGVTPFEHSVLGYPCASSDQTISTSLVDWTDMISASVDGSDQSVGRLSYKVRLSSTGVPARFCCGKARTVFVDASYTQPARSIGPRARTASTLARIIGALPPELPEHRSVRITLTIRGSACRPTQASERATIEWS
ncbi:hypothetical protein FVE85_6285 [Porphyridium purpureum]|uniref:Uncharacterized protein n=1 Tax=Porphyridium purpureum TaxID=35688 RepID=A0A5J4Z631_PORPP|nr:hypothetical protein FVE85_6285 [Porphyridium purpureum]|eukprot:POR8899..scf295_1